MQLDITLSCRLEQIFFHVKNSSIIIILTLSMCDVFIMCVNVVFVDIRHVSLLV